MKSWYEVRAAADGGAEVLIYDEIGIWGIRAADFIAELKALGTISALTVRINSPGGSVFDGLAIFNYLRGMSTPITVSIDGLAASMASVIAMCGDEVVMPENAMLMIHDPAGVVHGTAADMRDFADVMDKIKASLASAYRDRAQCSDDELDRLMAEETWLTASEAVALGLADRIAAPVKMAARFDAANLRNAPAQVKAMFEQPKAKQAPAKPVVPSPSAGGVAAAVAPAGRSGEEAMAYVTEVMDLCALAGRPDRAAAYIQANASAARIRRELIDQGAGSAGDEIHAHLPAADGRDAPKAATIDVSAAYAHFNSPQRK